MSPSAPIVPRMIRRIIAVAGIVVLGLEWANTGLFAQFSAGVQLIEVYATVTDANGELVMGLRQSDFQVVENDRPQEISAFAAGEFPLTVALGVDRSFSMAGEPLRLAKLASQTFLKQLKPGDRSMILAIGNNAEVIAPLSTDRAAQSQAIAALDAWSTTSLNDAVIVALDRLEPEKGRQALIVFSDGADRYSEATSGQVLARARRSQALVYPITMGKTRVPASVELATLTGGRSFLLRDAKELERTLSTIARELRYQYLIGYVPSAPPKPGMHEWRAIRVMLKNPINGLRVRARDGYTAE
jgi:Ca-activated chloride channel family protein